MQLPIGARRRDLTVNLAPSENTAGKQRGTPRCFPFQPDAPAAIDQNRRTSPASSDTSLRVLVFSVPRSGLNREM
jgi:hypothetical protein